MKNQKSHSGSLTTVITEAKEKGKKTIKIVLKQKPLPIEFLEKLNKEIELELEKYIERLIPKIQEIQADEPEKFLKYMLLQGLLNILEKIMKKYYLELTPDDKQSVQKIFENENDKVSENAGKNNEKFNPKINSTK